MVGRGAPAGLLANTGTPFLTRAVRFGVSACRTRSETTLPAVVRRTTASSFAASRTSSSRSSVVRTGRSSRITHQVSTPLWGSRLRRNRHGLGRPGGSQDPTVHSPRDVIRSFARRRVQLRSRRADRSIRPRSTRTLGARANHAATYRAAKPNCAAAGRRPFGARSGPPARRQPSHRGLVESALCARGLANTDLRPAGSRPKALGVMNRRRRDRFGSQLSRHAEPSRLTSHGAASSPIEMAWPDRRGASALRFAVDRVSRMPVLAQSIVRACRDSQPAGLLHDRSHISSRVVKGG